MRKGIFIFNAKFPWRSCVLFLFFLFLQFYFPWRNKGIYIRQYSLFVCYRGKKTEIRWKDNVYENCENFSNYSEIEEWKYPPIFVLYCFFFVRFVLFFIFYSAIRLTVQTKCFIENHTFFFLSFCCWFDFCLFKKSQWWKDTNFDQWKSDKIQHFNGYDSNRNFFEAHTRSSQNVWLKLTPTQIVSGTLLVVIQ